MKRRASPTIIGAFVLGAFVLALAGIVVFGSGTSFRRATRVVMYFEGSVAGLDIGAPVEFSGVRVGRVADMKLAYDDRDTFVIPVYAEILQGVVFAADGDPLERIGPARLVEMGLRARLESASFVTGKLKVSLMFLPGAEARLVGWDPDVFEIPTVPGMLESLIRTLEGLPLTNILNDAHRAVRAVADLVEDPATAEAVRALREAGDTAAALMARLDREVDPASRQFHDTLQALEAVASTLQGEMPMVAASFRDAAAATASSLEAASAAMTRLEKTFDPASPLRFEVATLVEELRDAARALRTFLDMIERDPTALIRGRSNP